VASNYGVKARLYDIVGDGIVKCLVCERGCTLKSGQIGLCGNYMNVNGVLYNVGYGLLSAVESRPIEIKPLFHYWPGSSSLTFSFWGCNFLCPWCQNYHLSKKRPNVNAGTELRFTPQELVNLALKYGDDGLCASFNEPTIGFDFLIDVFELGKKHGLYGTIVTNGYMSLRALEELINAGVDGFSTDIKGCPETYRKFMGASNGAEVVLRNMRRALDLGAHVEMVFLIVTSANDTEECIKWVIEKVYDVLGPDTPLHINRYYPAYMYHKPPTPIDTLLWAYNYAKSIGLRYVYIGNIGPGSNYENTYCPRCGKLLIRRWGTEVIEYNLDGDRCPRCGEKIVIRGKRIIKPSRWKLLF